MSVVNENYNRWLSSKVVDEKTKEILRNMSNEEKDDAFFKDIEFGTAGMRGILGPGTNRLNVFTVKKACVAFAKYCLDTFPNAKKDGIVISHDNRHMSREFTLLSAEVFNDFGIKAYIFDSLRPTPELSFAVRYLKACGGVMITASHNPKEHNGYKVYDETGCQLVPSKIQHMFDIIAKLPNELEVTYDDEKVRGETIVLDSKIDDEYVKLVEELAIDRNLDKKGFKIVFTPNHGTAFVNAMRVFKDLGYEVYPLEKQCTPDPDFSGTLSPNPEDARSFIEPVKYAKEIGANLVVMTDPDGDRCGLGYLASDGTYKTLTGNQSAAMLMDYIFSKKKAAGTLSKNGVMYNTIVTSSLGEKVAAAYGVKTEQFLTGFKYIGNRIDYYEKLGNGPKFEFGYEESYGCLVGPFARDKDGIQAIVLYSEMALSHFREGKTLDMVWDELGERFGYHQDIAYNIEFKGSEGASKMNELMDKLHTNPFITVGDIHVTEVDDILLSKHLSKDGSVRPVDLEKSNVVKLYFNDGTTIIVRPSGTEPKVKFYIGVLSKEKPNDDSLPKSLFEGIKKVLGI